MAVHLTIVREPQAFAKNSEFKALFELLSEEFGVERGPVHLPPEQYHSEWFAAHLAIELGAKWRATMPARGTRHLCFSNLQPLLWCASMIVEVAGGDAEESLAGMARLRLAEIARRGRMRSSLPRLLILVENEASIFHLTKGIDPVLLRWADRVAVRFSAIVDGPFGAVRVSLPESAGQVSVDPDYDGALGGAERKLRNLSSRNSRFGRR